MASAWAAPGAEAWNCAAGATGVICIGSDLSATPHASPGSVPVMVVDTWYFQAWYRDTVGGVTTSNFTDAVCITIL